MQSGGQASRRRSPWDGVPELPPSGVVALYGSSASFQGMAVSGGIAEPVPPCGLGPKSVKKWNRRINNQMIEPDRVPTAKQAAAQW